MFSFLVLSSGNLSKKRDILIKKFYFKIKLTQLLDRLVYSIFLSYSAISFQNFYSTWSSLDFCDPYLYGLLPPLLCYQLRSGISYIGNYFHCLHIFENLNIFKISDYKILTSISWLYIDSIIHLAIMKLVKPLNRLFYLQEISFNHLVFFFYKILKFLCMVL